MHLRSFKPLRFPASSAQRQPATSAESELCDEGLAGSSHLPLLITARTRGEVEAFARRIHSVKRADGPFVAVPAHALPVEASALAAMWVSLLERARGGSLLMADIEEMPGPVQERLPDVIDEIRSTQAPAVGVRLMSGTTTSVLDRVAAGSFSAGLFYRLNVLHLTVAGSGRSGVPFVG